MFVEFLCKTKSVKKQEINFLKERIKSMGEKGVGVLRGTKNFVSIISKNPLIDDYLKVFGYQKGILKSLSFVIIKYFVEGKLPDKYYG